MRSPCRHPRIVLPGIASDRLAGSSRAGHRHTFANRRASGDTERPAPRRCRTRSARGLARPAPRQRAGQHRQRRYRAGRSRNGRKLHRLSLHGSTRSEPLRWENGCARGAFQTSQRAAPLHPSQFRVPVLTARCDRAGQARQCRSRGERSEPGAHAPRIPKSRVTLRSTRAALVSSARRSPPPPGSRPGFPTARNPLR